MDLEHYHRALFALCFAEEHGTELADLARYRELVRGRFLALAKLAYRRSFALIGARALEACFARYLAAKPPRSPYVREVIAGFAPHALAELAGTLAAPAYARDVLRFEAARWQVADALDEQAAVDELDFDAALALNPTLVVLQMEHGVIDRDGRESEQPLPDAHVLFVYRRPDEDDVRWYRSQGLFAAVLASPRVGSTSLATLVKDAASGCAVDEAMLEELVRELSVAVERQVVLGSRKS